MPVTWLAPVLRIPGRAEVSEAIPEPAQNIRIARHLNRSFMLLTRHPLGQLPPWLNCSRPRHQRISGGSGQEAGPPPVEATGQPVAIDGVQARDVIVDVMDIQRD